MAPQKYSFQKGQTPKIAENQNLIPSESAENFN